MGAVWERFGSSLGEVWEQFGSSLGEVWERFGRGLGAVWERFGSGLGAVNIAGQQTITKHENHSIRGDCKMKSGRIYLRVAAS